MKLFLQTTGENNFFFSQHDQQFTINSTILDRERFLLLLEMLGIFEEEYDRSIIEEPFKLYDAAKLVFAELHMEMDLNELLDKFSESNNIEVLNALMEHRLRSYSKVFSN
jgi:hypothetical protein